MYQQICCVRHDTDEDKMGSEAMRRSDHHVARTACATRVIGHVSEKSNQLRGERKARARVHC